VKNVEIQILFEEHFDSLYIENHSISFEFWPKYNICSYKDFDLFKSWLKTAEDHLLLKYLKKDENIAQFLDKDESFWEKAIIENPYVIQFVKDQTKKLRFLAVKKYGMLLEHISEQEEVLCQIAISNEPFSLMFIKEQTVDLCLLALELDNSSFKEVRIVQNPDYETTLKNLLEKKAILEALR